MDLSNEEELYSLINLIIQFQLNNNEEKNNHILNKLYEFEKKNLFLIEKLLDILSLYNILQKKYENIDITKILIYIKNIFQNIVFMNELIKIKNIKEKIFIIIKIYIELNHQNKVNLNILNEIIKIIFKMIVCIDDSKNFLMFIFDNLIKKSINNCLIKKDYLFLNILFIFKNFSNSYLNYVFEMNEINFIFDYYNYLYGYCEIISFHNHENCFNLFKNLILSFIKTSIKYLDFYIKYKKDFYLNNNENNLIFFEENSFLNFIEHSLMLFSNKNNKNNSNDLFELISNKNNIFNFNTSIYKGLIIELLYYYIFNLIIINEINEYKNFLIFIEDISKKIIIYLIDYFKKNIFPIEKINNNNEELIQLSLIVKYLMFLEIVIKIPNVNEIFSIKKNEIFLYIIIPNILNNSLETFLFENNSKEYYKDYYDHLNYFEIKSTKQKALKILINMCIYNKNFFDFIINLYIKILFKLTSIENQDYFEENEIYFYLINNLNQEKLFENCLEIFTSIYFLILEDQKKFDFFSKSLNLINHILINIENDYLSLKLIIFYSHILPNFYNNEKFFIESLNFIFKCLIRNNLFNNEKNYSLFYISLRAINSLIIKDSLKNLCLISIKNFINKIIFFVENFQNFDFNNEEYYKFIKNIINKYLNYLNDDSMEFIDFYWKKFENCLENSIKNNLYENKQLDNDLNISNNINIIKIILKNIKNINNNYNYFLFSKILNLTNFLENFLNLNFEQEILEIITIILNNNFTIDKIYLKNLSNYLNFFNIEKEHNFKYKFEYYHIIFIYYFINCFKNEYLIEFKIKEIILNLLSKRLLKNNKIITKENKIELKIYLNFGLFYLFYFYDFFNENDIQILMNLFYKTFNLMNEKSNLKNKLNLNLFICLIKIENINLLDFLNINDFLNLIINYFQIDTLSLLEKRISSISILKILKYSILKFEKIDKILIIKLIKLNYSLLETIIKNNNKENIKSKINFNNSKEKFEIKNKNKVYEFNERKNTINFKKKLLLNKFYDEIENEKFLLEEKYENDELNNEDNENKNININNNMEIDTNNDNKNEKLLFNKKLYFNDYYKIFAKNNFKNYIENINEFQLFFLFLNDIKLNDIYFFNDLINYFNPDDIKNIKEFKYFKKIELETNDNEKCNYLFRKILKIKNKY